MVNRSQDAVKIKRIAQRFVSHNLEHVTHFCLWEGMLSQSKISVGLLFTRPYLLGTLAKSTRETCMPPPPWRAA